MAKFDYQTQPLEEDEDVQGIFVGNRGQVGSQFVVTNRRLLIGPLNVALAEIILTDGNIPGMDTIKSFLDQYGPIKAESLFLRHIADVQPTNNASLFKASGLRVTTVTRQTYDLRVVVESSAMSRDKRNDVARDQFVQVLREAVAQARSADT